MKDLPPPISISEEAAAFLRERLAKSGKPVAGVRVGVKNAGCSGMRYTLDPVESGQENPADRRVEQHGLTVFVPFSAEMFVIGSTMVLQTDDLGNAKIDFLNPNESGRCGCGESFRVQDP